MFRLMLASHPRIGIPPETGFILWLWWRWRTLSIMAADYERLVDDFLAQETAPDLALEKSELLEAFAQRGPRTFVDAMEVFYETYLGAVFPGKPRWGDKTTWYIDYIETLTELFPGAKFIHLIRDGRDVLCSYRNTGFLPGRVSQVALTWRTRVRKGERVARRLGEARWMNLRYEDLVQAPEPELTRVCEFLDETFHPDMLDFWRDNQARTLEPARHMAWKGRTVSPADPASVGRWRRELEAREVARFEALAGETLRRWGYDRSDEGPGPARRVVGRASGAVFRAYWGVKLGTWPWRLRARRWWEGRGS